MHNIKEKYEKNKQLKTPMTEEEKIERRQNSQRKYYEENKQKLKENSKEYYETNKQILNKNIIKILKKNMA